MFWLNVAAVLLFAGIAGYHYYRHRTRLVAGVDALLAPIASASTEAEVRARGETLARMAVAARREGGHLQMAMVWLAVGAACMFLWNAVSLSELREEMSDLELLEADLLEEVRTATPEPDAGDGGPPGDKGSG